MLLQIIGTQKGVASFCFLKNDNKLGRLQSLDLFTDAMQYLAITEWGWVSSKELWRSRRVLST